MSQARSPGSPGLLAWAGSSLRWARPGSFEPSGTAQIVFQNCCAAATIVDMEHSFLSVREAASILGVSPQRIRAMLTSGELSGVKVSGVWIVEDLSARERASAEPEPGAPFSEVNAWAIMDLASGGEAKYVSSRDRWRARQALEEHGLERIAARLRKRGQKLQFAAHPGVLLALREDPRLVPSGASVPVSSLSASGSDTDAYIRQDDLASVVSAYALAPASADAPGNVRLRPVLRGQLLDGRDSAPPAAVALDLLGMPDARSARVGRKLLGEIQARRSWQRR
jgi:excisionase family DNA binding protein